MLIARLADTVEFAASLTSTVNEADVPATPLAATTFADVLPPGFQRNENGGIPPDVIAVS